MKKNFIIISIVCLICVIFILSIHIIPTGYTGIKSTFGLIHPDPLKSGRIYFTIPFCESIEKINNKMQDFDIKTKIWGETNDKTPVYAEDLHITYQIMPERSVWIYTNTKIGSYLGYNYSGPWSELKWCRANPANSLSLRSIFNVVLALGFLIPFI